MDKKSGSSVAVPSSGSGSPSRQKQSLGSQEKSLQSTALRKVGILTHSVKEKKEEKDEEGHYEVKLYVVEIDNSSSGGAGGVVDPLVHFILPYRSSDIAVCVWMSTIYMFWGHNYRGRLAPDDEPQQDAKKFGLPEAKTVLTKEECQQKLLPIVNMKYPKAYPRAVPTPDGKHILVFGRCIPIEESESESTAFELYDPQENSWVQFPGLSLGSCGCDGQPCCCVKWVKAYTFIDETHFLVKLARRWFVLDLISKGWTAIHIEDKPWINDYFLTAEGRFVLTPKCAFQLEDGDFLTPGAGCRSFLTGPDFPLPNFRSLFVKNNDVDEPYDRYPSIFSLHPFIQEEGDIQICNTCILHIANLQDTGDVFPKKQKNKKKHTGDVDSVVVATLSLDVCRTELPSLTTNVSNSVSLDITISYSLNDLLFISI